MIFQIKYLNETKNIEINDTHKRIGYIQDEILNKFSLMIYNIEYTTLVHKNGTIYFGNDTESTGDDNMNTSYICYFDIVLKNYNINMEDILYFEIEDRHRDEDGNVIKNNKYIDNYNKFLTKKAEDEYDSYFENMVQEENNYVNQIRTLSSLNPLLANQPSLMPVQLILPPIQINMNQSQNEDIQNEHIQNDHNQNDHIQNDHIQNEDNHMIRNQFTVFEENMINNLMNQLANEIENSMENEEEIGVEEVEEEEDIRNVFMYSSNDYRNENMPNLPTHISHLLGMMNNPYNEINNILPLSGSTLFNSTHLSNPFRLRYTFSDNIRNIFNGTFGSNGSAMSDVKVTLTEDEYNHIETKKYCECCSKEEEDSKICIICNDEFKEDDIIKITKCKHVLHDECLKPWLLKESKKCPVCRMELGVGKAHIEEESKEDEEDIE